MVDKRINDIVDMLDSFMANNGGHMNISVNDDGEIKTKETTSKTVSISKSLDCLDGDLSCRIPNLDEGLDNSEENDEF